ncbi:MAG: response regulator transcription factor [Candidatus Binataceae bacterium]|jgi:FixJ family two-component response regulator
MSQRTAVAIIDDEASVRKSLARMLQAKGLVALAFPSAQEFLESPQSDVVSCVISDLRMPGLDGLGLQRRLHAKLPHLSMVFITGHGDIPASVSAMKAGAVDFLEKPVKGAALIDAIRRASERSFNLQATNAEIDALKARYETLTPREREVFSLVAAGLLNKQVAAELGVAEKTIKQHRGHVVDKMAAQSLAELVLMAERLGVRPSGLDFAKARGKLIS